MKKNIFFTVFLLSVFFSCSLFKTGNETIYFEFNKEKENIKIVEFEEINNIVIPNDSLLKIEFVDENEISYIFAGYKIGSNVIYSYEIDKISNNVTTKKTIFKFDLTEPIDFGYINSDSIFLVYPPAYRDFYHDSILLLINDEGDFKKSYPFNDAPVLCKNNPQYENNDDAVYFFSNLYEPFTFIDNKIFMMLANKTSILGDPAYSDILSAGFLDAKTEKFYPIKFEYPDIEYGKTFFPAYNKRFVSVLGEKNHILYGFHYTPTIIDYNYKTEKFSKHIIKSTAYDTIFPALTEKDIPGGFDFDMPHPKYFNLLYDKYRKLYYRFIFPPKDYGRKLSVVIADENFNFVAEGFSPTGFNFFFTKDYIISIGNKNKKRPKGKMYLTFYKLKFRDGTNQELISEIKSNKKDKKLINKPVTHYIKKNTNIKDKNYTATFMYYEMCPQIREFVLGFYEFNKVKISKNQVNLILVTQNAEALKNDLKKYNLLPENNSNIFIDSAYNFASYNSNNRNDLPRIIKVRQNKVKTDTIFNNDDGNFHVNFQKFLIASGKEQEKLKK
ncbi:MAG: DUF4221 domain-containing protein [Bacteroidales bacterium]|nr:DUF4221 domain-containing protein [Bacteroidales bacterium]